MPLYMVERVLPGATMASLEAVQHAVEETCRACAADAQPVHYRRSIFLPGESRCLCVFEAANAARVQEVNEAAQLPYERIVLAVEFPPSAPAEWSR